VIVQTTDGQGVPARLPERAEVLGHVIAVRGSQASVGLAATPAHGTDEPRVTVGKFLGIRANESLLIGVVTDVSLQTEPVAREQDYITVAALDVIGEILDPDLPSAHFRRGVADYPAIGDPVTFVGTRELRLIFNISGPAVIDIGYLQQDSTIGAYVDANDMISKHFAVLGTTGVGKSSGVALILQKVLDARPDLRVLVLDVHNEYRPCFGERAQVLSPRNMKLPFWLFNFEEIVDIFFGARPGLEEEVDLLSEVIPLAKSSYATLGATPGRLPIKRADSGNIRYTVDVPVPYRIADLVALLDARMGKLENRSSRMIYHRLMTRIESVSNDPRYAFMFESANVGGDTMTEILGLIFRQPANGVPMTIMQLAGFPSEVVDAVVSVLCRMAFDLGLWSNGANPLLVVCEEAHRYMSADHSLGFGPTRRAISRIAKEGRKYGVFLGLVTQRPAELDPTILSQCSTLFAMRMTNDRDQSLLRSAVSDTAANLLSFLPTLATGEMFAFGEGVALPTRLRFKELPAGLLPKSEAVSSDNGEPDDIGQGSLASVVARWRGVTGRQRQDHKEPLETGKFAGEPSPSSLLRRSASPLTF
jgi:DNA helicase HerA-like ATPase